MKRTIIFSMILCSTAAVSQAQITVSGVSNESQYTDQVTFTVQQAAGYSYDARLDGEPVAVGSPVVVDSVDYHELSITRTNDNTLAVDERLVQFIINSGERGKTESGLPPLTPFPLIPSPPEAFYGASFRLLLPSLYPADMDIPAVVWVLNADQEVLRANGLVESDGQDAIKLYRGVGSGFLRGEAGASSVDFVPSIGSIATNHTVYLETNTLWTTVSGTLEGDIIWTNGSRIDVTADLTLSSGSTLTIGEGTVVRVGPGVDIYSRAAVVMEGTLSNPVVFAPVSADQPWGGFIMPDSQGSVVATGTIFTGSGEDQDWLGTVGPSSHRPEQPLFACGDDNIITLVDSAAIELAGQLGHSETGSEITLTRFLLQNATTGGEYEDATFNVNDSALICFPEDSTLFLDGDHDALYIKNGTHGFTNTLFGWTKDDGVDSGGDGSGLLEFSNCWFEGILHEANSLSGTGKNVNHHHDVVLNCGQALEAGYGGPNGLLDSCLVSACMTGARFGDNYGDGRSYTGSMSATNSLLIYNYRDVWGFQWIDWHYHTERMTIEDNWLTAPLEQHPDNLVWNPESDAWRLVSYVNTPSVSPVGAGFAVHQLRDAISGIEEGMPVGLSCFTTNAVALDYVIDTPEGVLDSGSVILEPGQVIAMIPAPEAVPLSTGIVRVRLTGIDGAVITGIREIWFVRAAADLIPAGSEWRYLDDGSDGGTAWRNPGYDDSSWATGPAEFGYGEGDEATVVSYGPDSNNKYVTTYFRRAFVLDNPMAINALTLRLKRDDGGIVYLNGTEVFRSNLDAGTVDYLTYAPVANDDGDTWFSMDVSPSLLVPGTNIVAVEIHQSTAGSSDLTFDCGLSATPLPYIDYDWFGEDWVLFWQDPDARLEEAPTLEGPWSSLGAPGAYTVPYGENQGFYRLMQP